MIAVPGPHQTTLKSFLETAAPLGVREVGREKVIYRGIPIIIVMLERSIAGQKDPLEWPLSIKDDETFSPTVLHDVCKALQIPTSTFNFTDGWPPPDYNPADYGHEPHK